MRDMGDHNLSDEKNPEPEIEREFSARGVSDWIKKTIITGTSAEPFFSLLAQAEKTRRDVMQAVTRELRGFLNGIEVQDILLKVLSNAKLEVHATIRLVPDKILKKAKAKATQKTRISKNKKVSRKT